MAVQMYGYRVVYISLFVVGGRSGQVAEGHWRWAADQLIVVTLPYKSCRPCAKYWDLTLRV